MDLSKNKGKKWLLLLLLLLLIFICYFVYTFYVSKPKVVQKAGTSSAPTATTIGKDKSPEPEIITKCQSVVVTPKTTTELFTYSAGNKIMADYRVGGVTNEDSFKTQLLSDGDWVYLWNPPNYFGDGPRPENPRGFKMKATDFKFNINLTKKDAVERFGSSPLSGDHLCSEWDGTDSVFKVPSDLEFDESSEFGSKLDEKFKKICQICEGTATDEVKSSCRKNLVCD